MTTPEQPSSDPERAERKLATVLFADLVGSTALGASQDPERTRTMLDRFYDAMADEILVSERSAALVAGAFEFQAPMRVEAKGKPEGVECRRLVRALSLMRPRGVPGRRAAFVGRDKELGLLRRAHERTRTSGEPQ